MTDIFQMSLERNEIMTDTDGFYKYWPATSGIVRLTAEDLLIIADGLDRLNESRQRQLGEYFDTEEPWNDQQI